MNKIIKAEYQGTLFGHSALYGNVVADDETGRIRNQKIVTSRIKMKSKLIIELRFDDELNNGHESFSITGTLYEVIRGKWKEVAGGCLHDDIKEYAPELAPLIKWHLTSTDGPMHYVANTLYHASDRDCWGRAPGEVSRWDYGVRFNSVPVTHKVDGKFWRFLQNRHGTGEFQVVAIAHREEKYAPHYTFVGFGEEWHQCPFREKFLADEFCEAMNKCKVAFVKFPAAYSKGKERELEFARSSAIWPEATDEQLCLPKEELKELLVARLPQLQADFKQAMLDCGFLWPKEKKND